MMHPVIATAQLLLGSDAPFMNFLDRCFTADPYVSTVKQITRGRVTTLYSRFARAGLPTPADYLREARMGHSSGTALTRHIRLRRGMGGVAWRTQCSVAMERERFRDTMILPYIEAQRRFNP